jgi:hypothetical protein
METFKVIYRILSFLEASMKLEEFPFEQFNGGTFKASDQYFTEILKMLSDDGYVRGISFISILGQTNSALKFIHPEITIKGLEYLEDNSMMKKAANIAKGIIDIVK